jgi:hypothetical protein
MPPKGGIMLGVEKATLSRVESARVAYFLRDGRLGIIEMGCCEQR